MSVSWNILAGCVRMRIVFVENSFTTEEIIISVSSASSVVNKKLVAIEEDVKPDHGHNK